jgi:vitamin B12 transport system substrate-binding protein
MKFNNSPLISLYLSILLCFLALSNETQAKDTAGKQSEASTLRIVALSPHLTEIVFALNLGEYLVGVSDFSDYPDAAKSLPRVVSYQGANIPNILRLKPTHILAWKGGNKDVDIAKLQKADIPVYLSSIYDSTTLVRDIKAIASFLGQPERGSELVLDLNKRIGALKKHYQGKHQRYFYYLSSQPIMALGNDPWLNNLLSLCGLQNVFADSLAPYPQLSKAQILRKSPQIIISAGSDNSSQQGLEAQWRTNSLNSQVKLLRANPDKLHRFTARAIDELETICQRAYANH